MRPRSRRECKSLGVDLLGQGQQRPGKCPQCAGGWSGGRLPAPGGRYWARWPTLTERAAVVAPWAPLVARVALPGRAQERFPGVARSTMWRRGPVEPMGSHAAPPGPAPIPAAVVATARSG